jgi:dipeptidyl-peptidase-4
MFARSFLFALTLLPIALLAQQKLTLDEAVIGQFRQFAPKSIDQLQWIKSSDTYAFVQENALWIGKVKGKGIETKLVSLEEINTIRGGEALKTIPEIHWISAEKFWFENGAGFSEIDIKTKKSENFCSYKSAYLNQDYHQTSHRLAYTIDNNLYISNNGKELAITSNDKDVVSGQSVSRNEYGITKGTFWSPDGSKLAFYQKDETNVTEYPLVNYNDTPATVKMIKYPMAGGKSELISVGVFDVNTGKTIFLNLDKGKPNDQFYATNLTWSPDNQYVYIAWLNRTTTEMQFKMFDAISGKEVGLLFTEKDNRWVEPQFPAYFLSNSNDKFIWISQKDGFNNLYLYDTKGKLLGQTKFSFDVTEFLAFDVSAQYAFVMATGENPTEQNCFRVKLSDMSYNKVSIAPGMHRVQVSGSGMFVIDQFSSLTIPNKIDIIQAEGRLVKNLLIAEDPYKGKQIGQTELFTLKASDGSDLWCRAIKPSNFDAKKKYPVLVYLYGGPHAQMVTNSYLGGASLWMNYLAEEGFIVFTLDNRGSANRGKNFQQIIHRQLGTVEIEDQLVGVDWLKKQPFVDVTRMAIHGWSFGGFMTTSMMLKSPETFKVGVAGGPVISWDMYEVMYGERYMDKPQENPDGYKNSDLTGMVKNLKGDLLMIHGMDDDVVVMQHNVKFIKACVDNKVQVDFFAYPGHAHNVRGKDRIHLMTKVIEYIREKLDA